MNDLIVKIKIYLNHRLKKNLDRLNHIYSVLKMALLLGEIYQVDLEKITIAALLHDVTKYDNLDQSKAMLETKMGQKALNDVPTGCLHAYSAGLLAKEHFHISDQDIINAIIYHCSGRKAMSLLEQIIFVSDYIEETRTFVDESLRTLAKKDIDLATRIIFQQTINYLQNNKRYVSPLTIEALAYYKNKTEAMNEHFS
jgi:nicotinate-nucleotide adenylyltransferase